MARRRNAAPRRRKAANNARSTQSSRSTEKTITLRVDCTAAFGANTTNTLQQLDVIPTADWPQLRAALAPYLQWQITSMSLRWQTYRPDSTNMIAMCITHVGGVWTPTTMAGVRLLGTLKECKKSHWSVVMSEKDVNWYSHTAAAARIYYWVDDSPAAATHEGEVTAQMTIKVRGLRV